MDINEVNAIAGPMIRKYDWHTLQIDNGVRIIVTDGLESAQTDIITGENIKDEVAKVVKAVDDHNYTVIG